MNKKHTRFSSLAPLTADHQLTAFNSGEAELDNWLRERALKNMALGASRSYVLCEPESSVVIGYYALCMGQIINKEATGAMRRNMCQHRFQPSCWHALPLTQNGKGRVWEQYY